MPDHSAPSLQQMQEEAARRAREMQARAKIPPGRRPERRAPEPPPQPPGERSREGLGEEDVPVLAQAPGSPPPLHQAAADPQEKSVLASLFQDKERTIILALLILLSSEEGNQELLFALLFLLI